MTSFSAVGILLLWDLNVSTSKVGLDGLSSKLIEFRQYFESEVMKHKETRELCVPLKTQTDKYCG